VVRNSNALKICNIFLVLLFVACASTQEPPSPPNIVLIVSDDHAYQAVGAYGHGLNNTPNIDRIARDGALFTNSFVTNSICAPSRAVILTGKHSFINGKVDNYQDFDWSQDSFPKRLQSAGYQTALVGKIHLRGNPQGFDHWAVLPGQGHYYNPDFIIDGETKNIEGYVTTITTELALNWLESKRQSDKPFLLVYNQKAPHRNWQAESKYLNLFDNKTFEPPENFFDDYSNRGTAAKTQEMLVHATEEQIAKTHGYGGHGRWGHDFKLLEDPYGRTTGFANELERFTDKQKKDWLDAYGPKNDSLLKAYPSMNQKEIALWKFNRYIKDYLRSVQSVDDGVGQVLDYLEKENLSENTIVVYTSDQGFYLGEHGWFDKRFMYEESLRTPLLIQYPKEILPGTQVTKLVQNLDLAPTILDYAGLEIPNNIQGESFKKLLINQDADWRDAIYYTYYEYPSVHMVKRHYGIRTERYKLMHFYYDVDEWEMYDLQNDPNEMNNLYGDAQYTEIENNLHQRLEDLRDYYGDSDELNQMHLQRYLSR